MHHRDALAGLAACLVGRWQRRPAGLPLVEGVRTVGLGHAVDVHDPRSQLAHPGDHRWARRGTGHGRDQLPAERVRLRGTGDQRQYRRRAVEMGHPLVVEELPDHVGAYRPQAHVRGADRGDRPRCAPSVAVEHRQRPQVDALRVQPLVDDLAQRVEVRAAVGVHHALGRAGRPRGVVDRDQALLVVDRPGQRLIRAAFQELVVGEVRERGGVRWGRAEGIVDGHDQRDAPQPVQHRGQRGQVLGVDHQQRRPGVVADVADLLRGEPGVDRLPAPRLPVARRSGPPASRGCSGTCRRPGRRSARRRRAGRARVASPRRRARCSSCGGPRRRSRSCRQKTSAARARKQSGVSDVYESAGMIGTSGAS